MAVWQNDEDIVRDMDILSGIQSTEGHVKSYTSWGRGFNGAVNTYDDLDTYLEPQEKTLQQEEWLPKTKMLGKLPDSISRGKKLEILKENCFRSREWEVREQVESAVGHNHSNDVIEEAFKNRLRLQVDHKKLPDQQFEDSEEAQTVNSSLTVGKKSNDKFVVGQKETFVPGLSTSTLSSEVEKSQVTKSQRRKGRQYRNAVLESLEKKNQSENASFQNEQAKADDLLSTVQTGPMFGKKKTNIPPAGYFPRGSYSYIKKSQSETPFEYNESEFPNL